jgi:CO dehydrogenase/acetyl-CoA synthase beta subunit
VLKKLAGYYGVSVAYFYSPSGAEMKSTGQASAWLKTVRQDSNVKETIATYAPVDYSDEIKSKIAEKIAQKISEKKRGHKTSHGGKS